MRRAAPRPVATALERLTADIVPATLIAEVLRVWPEAAGEAFAAACTPTSAGKGELRVSCQSAVWAQELDLFSERVLERLNDLLDGERVERMRVKTGAASVVTADFVRFCSTFCTLEAADPGPRPAILMTRLRDASLAEPICSTAGASRM